jgi:hypothetical protein
MVRYLPENPADDLRWMKANDKNDHDSADVICAECKSVIAALHAPSAKRVARMSASNSSIAIFNTFSAH